MYAVASFASQMFAILGAAGNVGFATSKVLREAGMPVRAILRDMSKASRLIEIGCQVATADLYDPVALAQAIGNATVVQVILPPALQELDTAQHMRKGIVSLYNALDLARPARILVISDYGAHVTHDIGMPSIFHALEERLAQLECHKLFLRSAEHMQGWARSISAALETGTLQSFHNTPDALFPTISASDVGVIAAGLLLQPAETNGNNGIEIWHAEGPHRYSVNDIAAVTSDLGGQPISLDIPHRSQWESIFKIAMNQSLTDLLMKATDAQNQTGLVDIEPGSDKVIRGSTILKDALSPVFRQIS